MPTIIPAILILALSTLTVLQGRPVRRITVPTLVIGVAFSPDGQMVTAWDPAGWSRWDARSGRRLGREPVIGKACEGAAVLPRLSGGVVSAHCRGRLLFFDAASARALGERRLPEKQTAALYTASSSGTATAIVMSGATDTVALGPMAGNEPATSVRVGHEIEQLTLSAPGTRLSVGTINSVQVREVPGGTLLQTFEGSAAHALSADGRLLAMVSDRGARLFDTDSGQMLREVDGRVSHVRFSPDAQLVIGWTNQRLFLWNSATGTPLLTLTADELVAAAVSADGLSLVTVSLERRGEGTSSTIEVWQIPSGQQGVPRIRS